MTNKTLFLDRDGVINVQIIGGYVCKKEQFKLINGVVYALKILRRKFNRIVIVTNQQCVGRKLCTEDDIRKIHAKMLGIFESEGVKIDGVYYCPHKADKNCDCRKPKIGLALQAQQDFPDIDFSNSIMVGDSLSDMQFAQNAGMQAVHVGAKHEGQYAEIQKITPFHYYNLVDFAKNHKI